MADVRALLRQQRTARRVDHPHAVYSDSGKLSCAVCREAVRSDAAWDDHVRSALHRQSTRALQSHGPKEATASTGVQANSTGAVVHAQKRRRSETKSDDAETGGDGADLSSRRKRNRSEAAGPTIDTRSLEALPSKSDREARLPPLSLPQQTPPMARRSSGTPVQGVELRIPSRPATPIALKDSFLGGGGSNSSSGGLPSAASTPKAAPLGRSPLIPQEAPAAALADAISSAAGLQDDGPNSVSGPVSGGPQQIDEDEWAAFEADVVNAPPRTSARPLLNGVVVSAEPVSAKDIAAADEQRASRRAEEDAKVEDEKEEATRAREDEFEDMQELESRVRKLKEKREALRHQPRSALSPPHALDAPRRPSAALIDREDIRQHIASQSETADKGKGAGDNQSDASDDDEEEDDEMGGDGWDAFRFKA